MNRFHILIKVLFIAKVMFSSQQKSLGLTMAKNFSIEYEGARSEEIESALKQMNDWFFHTHIKDAEDNEF